MRAWYRSATTENGAVAAALSTSATATTVTNCAISGSCSRISNGIRQTSEKTTTPE